MAIQSQQISLHQREEAGAGPHSEHRFPAPSSKEGCRKPVLGVWSGDKQNMFDISPVPKLKALVYDILPSTTAVFSYAIGSWKLSANEQFFVGAQTGVSLLQTIKQGVSFIAANKVYTSTNKTTIVWIETELFLLPGVDASHVYVHPWALGWFYNHISTRTKI